MKKPPSFDGGFLLSVSHWLRDNNHPPKINQDSERGQQHIDTILPV